VRGVSGGRRVFDVIREFTGQTRLDIFNIQKRIWCLLQRKKKIMTHKPVTNLENDESSAVKWFVVFHSGVKTIANIVYTRPVIENFSLLRPILNYNSDPLRIINSDVLGTVFHRQMTHHHQMTHCSLPHY